MLSDQLGADLVVVRELDRMVDRLYNALHVDILLPTREPDPTAPGRIRTSAGPRPRTHRARSHRADGAALSLPLKDGPTSRLRPRP